MPSFLATIWADICILLSGGANIQQIKELFYQWAAMRPGAMYSHCIPIAAGICG